MPKQKLSDKSIRGLKAPLIGQVDVWDELLPGFGIRIGHGGAKSFFVGTRISGRYRRITLKPPFPHLELAEARVQARQIIAGAQSGIGPEIRKSRQTKGTFGSVASAFMEDFAHSHRTRKEMQRKIDIDLAQWHDIQISDIARSQIKELLREKARTAPISANRLLALISKIFTWALDEDLIDSSPAIRLPRYGEEKDRERVLSAEEIHRLWPAFGDLGYPFGDIYKIMLCTAQRRGEVASMRWSQIGADGWRLPAATAKTKVGHLVPLSSLAREILDGVPQIGEHVFIARKDAPPQGWSKSKARLDKLVRLVEPWQVEDTRRTAATHKENEEIRGLLNAGHRKGAVAGRCVVRGKEVFTEELPAYCAVAMAGLGYLPDVCDAMKLQIAGRAAD